MSTHNFHDRTLSLRCIFYLLKTGIVFLSTLSLTCSIRLVFLQCLFESSLLLRRFVGLMKVVLVAYFGETVIRSASARIFCFSVMPSNTTLPGRNQMSEQNYNEKKTLQTCGTVIEAVRLWRQGVVAGAPYCTRQHISIHRIKDLFIQRGRWCRLSSRQNHRILYANPPISNSKNTPQSLYGRRRGGATRDGWRGSPNLRRVKTFPAASFMCFGWYYVTLLSWVSLLLPSAKACRLGGVQGAAARIVHLLT